CRRWRRDSELGPRSPAGAAARTMDAVVARGVGATSTVSTGTATLVGFVGAGRFHKVTPTMTRHRTDAKVQGSQERRMGMVGRVYGLEGRKAPDCGAFRCCELGSGTDAVLFLPPEVGVVDHRMRRQRAVDADQGVAERLVVRVGRV